MIAYFGQLLIGLVFVIASIIDFRGRQQLLGLLASKNIQYREFLLPGAIGLKFICGLGLILNIAAPVAAFFLAGFTLIANVLLNDFWKVPAQARDAVLFKFLIYMGLMGGLLVIMGT
jgi:uncharacterized membrane protein YphA (DoxX/SURF4 family)